MHLLHVIGSLCPADGGPPEVSRQIVRAYAQVGDTVEIVSQDARDSPFLRDFPCPVHALGQRWLGRYGLSPRLWKWLNANLGRFDGVVVQGIWTFPGVAVRRAARRAEKPYCVFPHGALDPWFNKAYPRKHLKKLIYWPVQYPVLRDAQAVFFTSTREPDLAKTSFRPSRWNAVLFPNGVYEPDGDPEAEIEAFYRLLPALRQRPFLLFLARIQEKKGCDMLIEAFASVAPSVPDVDLVMAGPDQAGWQTKLKRMASNLGVAHRVHWPGMLSGDLKWGALRAAEAFVLPSHQENFGIAVVESLAAGRPVLISNQVNIWPEIESERVGLVEDDTVDGTARLLRRWFSLSHEERRAIARLTRSCFRRRYSLKNGARAIHDAFVAASLNAAAGKQSPAFDRAASSGAGQNVPAAHAQ